jgi:phage-related protein
MWNATRGLREFMANQFMAAWRDLVNAFNRAKEALQPFMQQIKWIAMFIIGVLLSPFVLVAAAIAVIVAVVYGLIIAIARLIGWFAQLLAWLIQVGSAIIRFFVNIPNSIHNFFVGADRWLINAGMNIIRGLWSGMIAIMGQVLPWLAGTGWKVVNAVGNFAGILWGAGWHALNSLWHGMQNSWGNIQNWLRGLGDKIKRLKGPIDKDKVMLLSEGKAVMQGFNKGLISGYQEVERTLSGITASMSQGNTVANGPLAQGSGQAPNATTNNNIYGNITLGDTSAVNTFFNRLDRNGELARKGMATI